MMFFNIPHVDEQAGVYNNSEANLFKVNKFQSEEVYAGGKLRRIGKSVLLAETEDIQKALVDRFPEYEHYIKKQTMNHISVADGYRSPYTDGHISLYVFETIQDEFIEKYGIDTNVIFKPWFGLKFDMKTREVMVKIPFDDSNHHYAKPDLPEGAKYYGKIYREDGSLHNEFDCYIHRTSPSVLQFCEKNKIEMPTYDNDLLKKISMWGFVYDKDSLQIKMVKGYVYPKSPRFI